MNIPGNYLSHGQGQPGKIMIIAGEPSGDLHGANLVKALKQRAPKTEILGIGGDTMARAGMKLLFHIRDLSVMGVTEVLLKMQTIARVFRGMKDQLARCSPDLLILIDYPGFNLKMAAAARPMGIPVLYYISPKVWAWKMSRLKKIKKYVDHVALIFPFEAPLYRKWKIPHTFVGHPLLDCHDPGLLPALKSGDEVFTIALLPGSRNSEIDALLEILLNASLKIKQRIPGVRFLISCATNVDMDRFNSILNHYNSHGQISHCSLACPQQNLKTCPGCRNFHINTKDLFQVFHGNVSAILSSAHVVIAASGTVSLEAALFRVPTIIVYKMSWMSYFLARLFVKIEYVGLANIIFGQQVMPELLQGDATPEKISEKVISILNDSVRGAMEKRLEMLPALLGGKGASQRVAALAFDMVKQHCNCK